MQMIPSRFQCAIAAVAGIALINSLGNLVLAAIQMQVAMLTLSVLATLVNEHD